MSYQIVYSLNLGIANTGLAGSLRAQLYTTAGAAQGGPITTGFAEVRAGSGRYSWTPGSSISDGFRGFVELYANGSPTTVGMLFAINPEEGFNLDAAVSTRAVAGAAVTYTGPVASTGTVTLVRSDDYNAADLHQLEFEIAAPPAGFPDLTGATWEFNVAGAPVAATITLVSQDPSGITVKVEITAAVSAALSSRASRYTLRYVRSGRKVTVLEGVLISRSI